MTNTFKKALVSGTPQIGLWLSMASPLAADAVSRLGYDWLLCDTEHAPLEVSGALSVLQAADSRTHVVVRPAWNDKVLIKRHLDQGVTTLLIPFVETDEEARAAVSATQYPPAGLRGVAGATRASGFGTTAGYFENAADGLCVILQIETGNALAQLEGIAGTEGVDAVFIGPSDLAASLGHLGNPGHPEVQAAIEDGLSRLKDLGVPAGTLAVTQEDAQHYIRLGFDFVAVGTDLGLLMSSAKVRLNHAHDAVQKNASVSNTDP